MKQASSVDGVKGFAQGDTDACSVGVCKHASRGHKSSERLTADVIVPEADPAVAAVHSIDGDDVGVADACDGPGLGNEAGEFLFRIKASRQQQLERDLSFERWIPGAKHFSERSPTE